MRMMAYGTEFLSFVRLAEEYFFVCGVFDIHVPRKAIIRVVGANNFFSRHSYDSESSSEF